MKTVNERQVDILGVLGIDRVFSSATDVTIKMNVTGLLKVEAVILAEEQPDSDDFPIKETANYQYTEEDGWVKEVAA